MFENWINKLLGWIPRTWGAHKPIDASGNEALRGYVGENPPTTLTPTPTPKMLSPLASPGFTGKEPTPTPTPTPQAPDASRIQAGFERWRQPAPPIATMSGQLAQAGQGLPHPLLPAIMSLVESGGLTNQRMADYSNPFGIMSPGTQDLVRYPDPQTAILGGGGQRGFAGLMRSGGPYEEYLQSGDLADFFKRYTPPSPANPSQEELIQRFNMLRSLFTQ